MANTPETHHNAPVFDPVSANNATLVNTDPTSIIVSLSTLHLPISIDVAIDQKTSPPAFADAIAYQMPLRTLSNASVEQRSVSMSSEAAMLRRVRFAESEQGSSSPLVTVIATESGDHQV